MSDPPRDPDLFMALRDPDKFMTGRSANPIGATREPNFLNKIMAGAAKEIGMPESALPSSVSPALNPKVERFLQAMKVMASTDPINRLGHAILEPTIRNVFGQLASGNIPGAAGAVATDVATLGMPQILGMSKSIPRMLESSTSRSYGKVLSTTKEVPKAIAETRVIPGALERGVTANTFEGLRERVGTYVEKTAKALDVAWKSLPANSKIDATPIWNELQDRVASTYIRNTNVLENPELRDAYRAIQTKLSLIVSQQNAARQAAVPGMPTAYEISAESARSWRQLMDKFVMDRKGFYIDKPLAAEAEAKRVATNAIRAELASEHPEIAKINAEFNFWRNFQEILDATATRRTGQENALGRKIMLGAGAAAGLATGGPTTAFIDTAMLATFDKSFRSTAWRTRSAMFKDNLAKAIVNGDAQVINVIAKQLTEATGANLGKVTIPTIP